MRLRSIVLVLFTAIVYAQNALQEPSGPPPADVDQALRARVAAFYSFLVQHQYRKAEELVAPDARDAYYEREKPRYISSEVAGIVWSQNFTYAEVTIKVMSPSFMPMSPNPTEQQIKGIWRLLDGAWYWSPIKVTATDLLKSMYGVPTGAGTPESGVIRVAPGSGATLPDPSAAAGGPVLPTALNLPGGMGRPDMMQLGAGAVPSGNLRPDHANLTLAASSSDKVVLTNASQSSMTLFILGKLDDVETTFEPAIIKPGEKAVLTVKTGPHPKGGPLLIGVNETHEVVSLPIFVK